MHGFHDTLGSHGTYRIVYVNRAGETRGAPGHNLPLASLLLFVPLPLPGGGKLCGCPQCGHLVASGTLGASQVVDVTDNAPKWVTLPQGDLVDGGGARQDTHPAYSQGDAPSPWGTSSASRSM